MLWLDEKDGPTAWRRDQRAQNGDAKAEDLTVDSTLQLAC